MLEYQKYDLLNNGDISLGRGLDGWWRDKAHFVKVGGPCLSEPRETPFPAPPPQTMKAVAIKAIE